MNNFLSWFRDNGLTLVVLGGSALVAWAVLSTRVEAVEEFIKDNQPLIARFYVLEEKDKQNSANIEEIRQDIKDIKGTNQDILIKLEQIRNAQ